MEKMEAIRLKIEEYDLKDIYNMDETGLYWKMLPDTTLATEQMSGVKKEKSRISIVRSSHICYCCPLY